MKKRDRIYGIENEFFPFCSGNYYIAKFMKDTHSMGDTLADLFLIFFKKDFMDTVENLSGIFLLNNQIKIYPDRKQIELATPECSSPKEVLLYDKEAERIMAEKILQINSADKEKRLAVSAVKNNYDFSYATGDLNDDISVLCTRGTHENYLVLNHAKTIESIRVWVEWVGPRLLGSFLATRSIISGNGCIFGKYANSRDCSFILSQRANFIDKLYTEYSVTMRDCVLPKNVNSTDDDVNKKGVNNQRALINLKHDPLSNRREYLRLHLICGDANLAEWSTYLKMGITGIFLSMIEDKFFIAKLSQVCFGKEIKIVKVFHEVVSDLTFKKKLITLQNGKQISALQHQTLIYELAQEYFRQTVPCEWEKDIMKKWGYVLSRLEAGDINSLSDKLDWAIKLKYLNLFMKKHNITSYSDPRVRMMDFQYHELHPERSIFKKLQDRGKIQTILTQEEREFAKNNPPPTRALWRKVINEEIRQAQRNTLGSALHESLDWENIRVNNVVVYCRDPFAHNLDEILRYQTEKIRLLTANDFMCGSSFGASVSIYESPTILS